MNGFPTRKPDGGKGPKRGNANIQSQLSANVPIPVGIYSGQGVVLSPAFTAGNNIIAFYDSMRQSSELFYTKLGQFLLGIKGTYRVSFGLRSNGGSTVYGRIYRNGVPYGTERVSADTNVVTYAEDLVFNVGDTVELWVRTENSPVQISNFRLMVAEYVGLYS